MTGKFIWLEADELFFAPPQVAQRWARAHPDPFQVARAAIQGHEFGDAESTTQAVAKIIDALKAASR